MDHSKIIALWESSKEMKDAFEVPYQTAAAWRLRGRIPPKHWKRAIELAAHKGVTLTPMHFVESGMAVASSCLSRGAKARLSQSRKRGRAA